jgi:MFS transporter, SP family, xylose:H+ symportor
MTSADLPAHIEAERASDFNRAYVFAISITAALGGLMFGYDWVVIGGAEPFYEKYFHLESTFQIGWAMSSALIGALFGATSAGVLSDKFGRKPILLASGLRFVLTSIGTGLATHFDLFVINRLLGGHRHGVKSVSARGSCARQQPDL